MNSHFWGTCSCRLCRARRRKMRATNAERSKIAKSGRRVIWMRHYRPFILGGNVNGIIGSNVPVTGPYPIGKGFYAYLAESPKKIRYVICARSGGIVGNDLATVRADVRAGKKSVMEKQVREACEALKRVEVIHERKFWEQMDGKIKL